MVYQYKTKGTCSSEIDLELEDDTVKSVKIIGGCNGNGKGICALVEGMKADEAIRRLKGIKCGFRSTSCPDQLAIALSQAKEQQGHK
ncbi:MAG: TIGR03905 family TSCPD domain-containing protein [bacterium]